MSAGNMQTMKRYDAIMWLIPLILLLYLVIVSLKPAVSNTRDAAYPIFSWALFANTPSWIVRKYVVIAHSVDGRTVRRYVIPCKSPAHGKALRTVVRHCRVQQNCDHHVRDLLYPIVRNVLK